MARTTTRIPMPVKQRAKQFAMFDALKGLTEAIAEKERQYDVQRELANDRIMEINEILSALKQDDAVTVEYYCQYGMCYRKTSGRIKKIDLFWKELQIGDIAISFYEIADITICQKQPQSCR